MDRDERLTALFGGILGGATVAAIARRVDRTHTPDDWARQLTIVRNAARQARERIHTDRNAA